MNKEEKRINNKCNFIDTLLFDNGLYKGVSALVEIEEHISNLYDEIDNYKHQLEEKDKIINEAINFINMIKNETYQSSVEGICDTALEILERGKNEKFIK